MLPGKPRGVPCKMIIGARDGNLWGNAFRRAPWPDPPRGKSNSWTMAGAPARHEPIAICMAK